MTVERRRAKSVARALAVMSGYRPSAARGDDPEARPRAISDAEAEPPLTSTTSGAPSSSRRPARASIENCASAARPSAATIKPPSRNTSETPTAASEARRRGCCADRAPGHARCRRSSSFIFAIACFRDHGRRGLAAVRDLHVTGAGPRGSSLPQLVRTCALARARVNCIGFGSGPRAIAIFTGVPMMRCRMRSIRVVEVRDIDRYVVDRKDAIAREHTRAIRGRVLDRVDDLDDAVVERDLDADAGACSPVVLMRISSNCSGSR